MVNIYRVYCTNIVVVIVQGDLRRFGKKPLRAETLRVCTSRNQAVQGQTLKVCIVTNHYDIRKKGCLFRAAFFSNFQLI